MKTRDITVLALIIGGLFLLSKKAEAKPVAPVPPSPELPEPLELPEPIGIEPALPDLLAPVEPVLPPLWFEPVPEQFYTSALPIEEVHKRMFPELYGPAGQPVLIDWAGRQYYTEPANGGWNIVYVATGKKEFVPEAQPVSFAPELGYWAI